MSIRVVDRANPLPINLVENVCRIALALRNIGGANNGLGQHGSRVARFEYLHAVLAHLQAVF